MCKNRVLSGRVLAICAALGLGLLIVTQTAEAQKTKGKTRPAQTKYLMRCVMQPNCAALGGLLKEKGPADDKGWDQVTANASVLNELGFVLMDDGRCPDATWAGATKTLKECSSKVLEAAKEKNAEDAQAAFKALTGACAACHTAHKPKAK